MAGFTYPVRQTERSKRWLSWNLLSHPRGGNGFGVKQSYAGTTNPNAVTKRRAKNKVAKASRRANR